jgi:hypothetical protein
MSVPLKRYLLVLAWLGSLVGAWLVARQISSARAKSGSAADAGVATGDSAAQTDPKSKSAPPEGASGNEKSPATAESANSAAISLTNVPVNRWQARQALAGQSEAQLKSLAAEAAKLAGAGAESKARLLHVLSAWSRLNPTAVLEFIAAQPESAAWSNEARMAAYSAWAAQDPAAAIYYHRAHEGKSGTDMLGITGIYGGWLQLDPESACLFYQRELDSRKEGQPVVGKFDAFDILPLTYRRELLWGPLTEAVSLSERLPFGHARTALTGLTARSWAAMSPEEGFAQAKTLEFSDERRLILLQLAAEAASSVPQLSAEEATAVDYDEITINTGALHKVFAAWCEKDLAQATAWLTAKLGEKDHPQPLYDSGCAEAAKAYAKASQADTAKQWAEKIYDDNLREKVLGELSGTSAGEGEGTDKR